MGRAAEGMAAGGQKRYGGPLAGLRYHWGEAYEFSYRVLGRRTLVTARRRDGQGGVLADPLTEGLRLRVIADYTARPVPRSAR